MIPPQIRICGRMHWSPWAVSWRLVLWRAVLVAQCPSLASQSPADLIPCYECEKLTALDLQQQSQPAEEYHSSTSQRARPNPACRKLQIQTGPSNLEAAEQPGAAAAESYHADHATTPTTPPNRLQTPVPQNEDY